MKAPSFQYVNWNVHNASASAHKHNLTNELNTGFCQCLDQLQQFCYQVKKDAPPISNLNYNSDVGRMMYSIAILCMFSMIILLLMIRSIKRSNSATIEVEALLHSMQYREELDMAQRQKRRLQKAKNKVTAWLTKSNGKMWNSSPQIILPNSTYNGSAQRVGGIGVRNDSMQSSGSFLPEIVISNSEDIRHTRQNSYTPSLSLIYDFSSRKNSSYSEYSDTIDLSQLSDISHDLDLNALSPQPMLGSQLSLNAVAGSVQLGTSSI